MGKIRVYISSISANKMIKKHQQRIQQVLESKKIDFEVIDITSDAELREEMRKLVGDDTALPPQIFNGDIPCGGYDEFDNAIEEEALDKFLKLTK